MPGEPRTPSSDEIVWNIYKALGDECHHFNSLESTYRTLASTWLLASFGGIGYVLKEIEQRANTGLFVAGIAAAGALGILLLEVLDLFVYHRMLQAAFAEQWLMEKNYNWLPRVAHRMVSKKEGGNVVHKVVWFYLGTYLLLTSVCAVSLGRTLFVENLGAQIAAAGFLFVVGGVIPGFYLRQRLPVPPFPPVPFRDEQREEELNDKSKNTTAKKDAGSSR